MNKIFLSGVTILFVFFSYLILNFPLIGMMGLKIEGNFYEIIEIHPVSWASFSEVETGDRVHVPDSSDENETKIEMVEEVLLEIDDKLESHKVAYQDTSAGFIFISILPIIICLINILIAWYLLRKYKALSINFLALLFVMIGITYLSASISARDYPLGILLNSIGLLACPIILLYFLNQLYYEKTEKKHIEYRYLHLLSLAALTIGLFDVFLFEKILNEDLILYAFSTTLFITAFPSIRLIRLLNQYINEYKLKLLYYGVLIAFIPFITLYIIPVLMLGESLISAEAASLFFLFISFVGVYIMLIDVLPDVEYHVNKWKKSFARSFLPSIIIAITAFFAIDIGFTFSRLYMMLVINFLVIGILLYVLDPTYKLKEHFDESFLNFANKGRSVRSKESLIINLIHEIEQRLAIPKVSHFIFHQKNKMYCISEPFDDLSNFSEIIQKDKTNIKIGQLFSTGSGYYLVAGIHFHEIIILFLPYKKGIVKYNKAEKYWLRTITVINQGILDNLKSVNKMVDELEGSLFNDEYGNAKYEKIFLLISEKERKRIATDIHDTLLQELIFLTRTIDGESPNGKLDFIKERLLDQIKFLRDSCYELNPVFVNNFDFIEAVNNLILTYRLRENMQFSFFNNIRNYSLSEPQMNHLYRIIQELLVNAIKHSKADQVFLSLTVQSNVLRLEYNDNGVGLNIEKRSSSKRHFGLVGIKHRVRSMDGKISFSTIVDKGLDIVIIIENISEDNFKREDIF